MIEIVLEHKRLQKGYCPGKAIWMRKVIENVVGFLAVGVAGICFLIFIVLGPGGLIATIEWPFGTGPFSSQGSYCTDMHHFASNLIAAERNQSSSNIEKVRSGFSGLTQNAPNQKVSELLSNWETAIQAQDSQAVTSAVNDLNSWIGTSCSSPAYKLPYQINSFWGGFFGTF